MPALGRKLTDIAQKTKGRQALRFQLELIPYFLDTVPASVKQASFMWERGAKLQFTEPSPVNTKERAVYWGNTLLKQTATLYKENDVFVSKEYLFKAQSVALGSEKRSTFAKAKIDLSKYCSCESNSPREVYIPMQPSGTLRISIQATWLRHSSPENDTMTEISAMSLGRSGTSSMEDQDLSGFDSQQSKILGMRQRQAVMTPFGSKTPPRSPSPEPGPLRRGASSLPGSSVPSSVSTTANRRKVGFLDVQLNEDQETPRLAQSTMPRRPAHSAQSGIAGSAALARATTDPAAVTSAYESSQQQVASGIPPEDYDKILNESYATLISSDSEDEEGGVVASAKRWWSNSSNKKDPGYQPSKLRPREADGTAEPLSNDLEVEVLNKEDVTSLRQLCKQALRERDQEQLLRQQAERRARHLQSDCEALAMSKSMLVERLREAEDRLMTMRQEETMNALVQAKIKLAQADYVNLELQGHLGSERDRVRMLKQRLTDLEAAYHATLDSLDGMQPRSAAASAASPSNAFSFSRRLLG